VNSRSFFFVVSCIFTTGLALSDEEVLALWNCTVVPPSDLVNSEDFAAACEKHPPA
jgi:hypothetical protein